jgi:hypothetical protein
MIRVYIFENEAMDYNSGALDNVVKVDGSSEKIVYGSKSPIRWHPVWNNFHAQSFDGQPVIATRKLIFNEKGGESAQAKFDQALLACREASGMCLMFFDMHLGEVMLNASHFEINLNQKEGESETDFVGRKNSFSGKLNTLLQLVTNATVIENQIEFFHKTTWVGVGMFLMLNALANPEIDGDFIAATQKRPKNEINRLNKNGFPQVKMEGSLSKVGKRNAGTAEGRLADAINDFCQARQITLEKLLWPQDSSKWFFSDQQSDQEEFSIPHSFSVFGQWYSSDKEKCESQIGEYLRRILIYGYRNWNLSDTSTLDQWYKVLDVGVKNQVDCAVAKLLNQKWFYEKCLKSFVGSGAWLLTGNGDKPFVCCFLMPLLAATGPAMWINSLSHSDSRCKFAIEDKTYFNNADLIATRKIIMNSYELFKELVRSQNSQNEISVSIDNAANCDFFSLQVGFPATRRFSDNENKPPLLSLTQFLAGDSHDGGGTMRKYVAFQKSCIPIGKSKDRSVYSWILPGTTDGFTEIRIGGVERE